MTTVELDLADEYDSDMSLIRSYLSDRARSPETIRSNKSNLRIIARFLKRARVMREMYGELPKYPFTQNNHYLRLLQDLREESTKLDLNVRTIEKALFKKNFDK